MHTWQHTQGIWKRIYAYIPGTHARYMHTRHTRTGYECALKPNSHSFSQTCTCTFAFIRIYICTNMHAFVRMFTIVFIYMFTVIYGYIYACIYTYAYIRLFMCMYVSNHTYACMQLHTQQERISRAAATQCSMHMQMFACININEFDR